MGEFLPKETVSWTAEQMNAALTRAVESPAPALFAVSPRNLAVFQAAQEFAGRDWRRIKREMNKAWKRAGRT